MVLGRHVSTTVEGRSIWCYFGETCGYHSRLAGYSICPGEACLCQLLTDNLLTVTQPGTRKVFLLAFLMATGV